MPTIKMTSKRQATFPQELCGDLGIQPGDQIIVEPIKVGNKKVWTIQPVTSHSDDEWFGALSDYAKGKSHKIEDIKASIAEGMGLK